MQKSHKKHYAFFFSGLIDILILDFVTKLLVVRGVIGETVFIKDFFYLTSVHKNDGIAFGIDLPMWIQIGATFVILYLLIQTGFEYILKEDHLSVFKSAMLGMVIGGGLGNLIDRVMNGYVVDFIVLGPIPVFNVADIGITVGLVLLFATIALSSEKSKI